MPVPPPSLDLYRRVRAGFIVQGTTLKAWCRDRGTHIQNARSALIGTWDGPAGRRLRSSIVKAARISGDLS